MERICPFLNLTTLSTGDHPVGCQKARCSLWVGVYTTENHVHNCCAFEMIALKNSMGQYQV